MLERRLPGVYDGYQQQGISNRSLEPQGMTAEHFAGLLHAKKTGRGRWMALCPGHPDRKPSLSITKGNKYAIVFCCRSQHCPQESILAAMGLTWTDLLGDRITDPRKLRELEMKRKQEESARQRQKYHDRVLLDQCRWWDRHCRYLAGQLAANDNARTALQYHGALAIFRRIEAQCEPILHPKGV